jgi:hypothetical protein
MIEYQHDNDSADDCNQIANVDSYEVVLRAVDSLFDEVAHEAYILSLGFFLNQIVDMLNVQGLQKVIP